MVGINIDYRHWPTLESQHEIAADCAIQLNCTTIRTVLKPDEEEAWNEWHHILRIYGIGLIAVLARESGNDWEQYKNYKFEYLQVGNEPFSDGESSYDQSYEELNRDLKRAYLMFPDVYKICAGVADGNPEHLKHIHLDYVNAIAVHPGIETLDTIESFLFSYSMFGKPIIVTEYYDPDLTKILRNYRNVIDALFFCYDEVMVKGHGLYDHGVSTPKLETFRSLVWNEDINMNVGSGILNEMAAHGDRPIRDSEFYTNVDGTTYEKGYGEKGFYEASNAHGNWQIYFRPYSPLA